MARSSGTRSVRHYSAPVASVGGQALIEGVMMRNGNLIGKAVRLPDGSICTEVTEYNGASSRIPVWRGFLNLCKMAAVGAAAMQWSANKQLVSGKALSKRAGVSALVAGVAIALSIFLAIPFYLGRLTGNPILAEGLIRFGLVAGYLFGISYLRGVGELFQYHASEHRAVWAYEKGLPLTVANVRQQSSLHPRCGSGLVLALVLIAGLLFPLLAGLPFYLAIPARLILVPVVAGLGVEFIKALANIRTTLLGRVLLAPFLATQLLTTRTPTDAQIECAIAALEAVLPVETRQLVAAGA